MESAIGALRERIHLPVSGSYLIGLSGGADSVALTRMLLPDVREGRFRLWAVHVNHGLRGAESDEDEHFVKRLCRQYGIPCQTYRADLGERRDESTAREARFGFFRKALQETGAEGIFLAHHGDDQAETFLMRLLRGAGAEGLAAMAERQKTAGFLILRPMLGLNREEIREALRKDGIPWREDSSNGSGVYLRNRVRHELIPLLEDMAPGAAERIRTAAGLLRQDSDALRETAEKVYAASAGERLLRTEGLEDVPEAVQSRVLRMWWRANGVQRAERELSSAQTQQLQQLLRVKRGKINLPGGYHAVRTQDFLHLSGPVWERPAPVEVSGTETCFGQYRLTETPSEGNPGDGISVQEVPEGFTKGCLIRTRRPGDIIRPFGSAGRRKLQDYLTDRKIPEPFRDRIPMLCRGEEVLLVCGVGAGDVPVWDGTTHHVRLTWHGEMPWSRKERN